MKTDTPMHLPVQLLAPTPISAHNPNLLENVVPGQLYIAWFRLDTKLHIGPKWTIYFCENDRINQESGWMWQLQERRDHRAAVGGGGLYYWTPEWVSPVDLCHYQYLLGLICLGHCNLTPPGAPYSNLFDGYITAITRELSALGGRSTTWVEGMEGEHLTQVVKRFVEASIIAPCFPKALPKRVCCFGMSVRDIYIERRGDFFPVVDVAIHLLGLDNEYNCRLTEFHSGPCILVF